MYENVGYLYTNFGVFEFDCKIETPNNGLRINF